MQCELFSLREEDKYLTIQCAQSIITEFIVYLFVVNAWQEYAV